MTPHAPNNEPMHYALAAVAASALATMCAIAAMMLYAAVVSKRLAVLEAEAKVLRHELVVQATAIQLAGQGATP